MQEIDYILFIFTQFSDTLYTVFNFYFLPLHRF